MSKMRIEHDKVADAAYVFIKDADERRTEKLDDDRLLDRDFGGRLVGIEFLNVSRGVRVHDLPCPKKHNEIEQLLDREGIQIRVPALAGMA